MRSIFPVEQMMGILMDRYREDALTDPRMRRYLDVMPQVIAQMQDSLYTEHLSLRSLAPGILPILALNDDTPQREGFSGHSPEGHKRSHLDLFSLLRAHYGNGGCPGKEPDVMAGEHTKRLTTLFSNYARAYMGFDQLHFFEHSFATNKKGKASRVPALGIDAGQLMPLMKQCGIEDEAEFFKFLGVKTGVILYPGAPDAENGVKAWVAVVDPEGIRHLKDIGATITPDPHGRVVQPIFVGKMDEPLSGQPASVLPWAEWARKVEERKARRESGQLEPMR